MTLQIKDGRMLAAAGLLLFLVPHLSCAGEPSLQVVPVAPAAMNLTLRGALTAAVNNNPDVQLYRERIEAAKGQVQTQLGTMLPNLSSTVRQSRQTQFLGTLGLLTRA
jgi:outer membrane protein TolC